MTAWPCLRNVQSLKKSVSPAACNNRTELTFYNSAGGEKTSRHYITFNIQQVEPSSAVYNANLEAYVQIKNECSSCATLDFG